MFTYFSISEAGFVTFSQIEEIIPIDTGTWWEGVELGLFPKPVKLSARSMAWRAEDIERLIRDLACQSLSFAKSRDNYFFANRQYKLDLRRALLQCLKAEAEEFERLERERIDNEASG